MVGLPELKEERGYMLSCQMGIDYSGGWVRRLCAASAVRFHFSHLNGIAREGQTEQCLIGTPSPPSSSPVFNVSLIRCCFQVVAGGKLFNVVVDSEATGKLLLSPAAGLKRRVTIIPLSKIDSRSMTQEVVDRARRLVRTQGRGGGGGEGERERERERERE